MIEYANFFHNRAVDGLKLKRHVEGIICCLYFCSFCCQVSGIIVDFSLHDCAHRGAFHETEKSKAFVLNSKN